jgi:transcriptional regulator with XRE-family HTH domain
MTPSESTGRRSRESAAGVAGNGLQSRDPSPSELGHRIKMMRISRGLTLKDLEERGGISATHVSEIERGKASPTVGALGRIARALELRPATLVEPRVLPQIAVMRAAERGAHRVQCGSAVIEPLTEPVDAAEIGGHLMTLPVRREPALTHRHEGEEWLTVLSGAIEVRVEGQSFVVREGDSIHFRAHREHSYLNLASNPAVILMAVRPRLSI